MSMPMPDSAEPENSGKPSRRRFLELLGKFSFFAGFAGICTSTLRFMLPNVLYEPPTSFIIGKVKDFPPSSVTFLEDGRLFIFRQAEGMFAVSSVCTHLGCNVRWDEQREGFECPCHGSSFDRNGKNTTGPAPRPLKWYELTLVSDGNLQIDTRSEVDNNFRLRV